MAEQPPAPPLEFLQSDLQTLTNNLIQNGPFKIESTPRQVRALFDGVFLFDTTSAKHVWEHKYFPHFWVPKSSIKLELLSRGPAFDKEGYAYQATVKGSERSTNRVVVFEKGPLEGLVRVEFKAMGEWERVWDSG